MNGIGGNEEYNMGQSNTPFAYKSAPTQVYFDNPATSYTSGLTAAAPYFPADHDDGRASLQDTHLGSVEHGNPAAVARQRRVDA